MSKKKNPLTEAQKPPERTIDAVVQEYRQYESRAGALQYQIVAIQADLDVVNTQMLKLNQEHFKLQQEAQAKAQAEAVAQAAATRPPESVASKQ